MSGRREMILSTVQSDKKDDVMKCFDTKGFVITILYLIESVWDEDTIAKAKQTVETRDEKSYLYKLLFEEFKILEHFRIADSHKLWIQKSYRRLKDFVPNMTENDAKVHDMSKYNFVQAIGYTAKWVHNLDWNNKAWQTGLQDHYKREAHHPEYCKGRRMARKDLEESLIDMVACRWERQLEGDESKSNSVLVDFDSKFLARYLPEDKEEVLVLMKKIREADTAQAKE